MKPSTLNDLKRLSDKQVRAYLEAARWPDGATCPRCDRKDKAIKLRPSKEKRIREGLYHCGHCRRQFTATTGTVFHGSKLPLSKWFHIIASMCGGRKGVSARQLQRELNPARKNRHGKTVYGNYEAIWYACHRVRHAMTEDGFGELMKGVVEADEAFKQGKPRWPEGDSKERRAKATKIVALVERGGRAKAMVVNSVNAGNLRKVLVENVDPSAILMTDGNPSYNDAGTAFAAHMTVNHSAKEYARKDRKSGLVVSNNTAESFFSLVKRSIYGMHHHYSHKHTGLYIAERAFTWTHRDLPDVEKVGLVLRGAADKRMVYKAIQKDAPRPCR